MNIDEIMNQFGVFGYGAAILFGGIAGVRYFPSSWKKEYKFLFFSMIIAIVFVLLEVFVQKTFEPKDATKYLITFCVTAVCYQYFIKKWFEKWGIVPKDEDVNVTTNKPN